MSLDRSNCNITKVLEDEFQQDLSDFNSIVLKTHFTFMPQMFLSRFFEYPNTIIVSSWTSCFETFYYS